MAMPRSSRPRCPADPGRSCQPGRTCRARAGGRGPAGRRCGPTGQRAGRLDGYAVVDLGDFGRPRIQVTLTDGPLAFLLPGGDGPDILARYADVLTAAGYDASLNDAGTSVLITPLPGQRLAPAAAQRARTSTRTSTPTTTRPAPRQHGRHAAPAPLSPGRGPGPRALTAGPGSCPRRSRASSRSCCSCSPSPRRR